MEKRHTSVRSRALETTGLMGKDGQGVTVLQQLSVEFDLKIKIK